VTGGSHARTSHGRSERPRDTSHSVAVETPASVESASGVPTASEPAGTEPASGAPTVSGPAGVDVWPVVFRGVRGERSDLVPVLQRAQGALGYLSPETVARIARRLRLSESEVYGVATFYAQFRFTPPGRHRLRVCLGTACHVKGGVQMLETVERRYDVEAGGTTADGEYDLERVACLGCCAQAPVVTVDDTIHAQMSVIKLQEILGERDGA
jgi:NADH-quinone oxidoreductase subunit E